LPSPIDHAQHRYREDALTAGSTFCFVQASTSAVYGEPEIQPITEETSAAPTSPYGETKLAAETAVAERVASGVLGAAILRAFNVSGAVAGHGDDDKTRIIPEALAVAAGHVPHLDVNGDGTAVRDFVHRVPIRPSLGGQFPPQQPQGRGGHVDPGPVDKHVKLLVEKVLLVENPSTRSFVVPSAQSPCLTTRLERTE
jgi:hypothetical protein